MKRPGFFNLVSYDEHRFGIPNALTVARLIFLPFVVHFLRMDTLRGNWLALLFMLLSCLSDYFDGYVARKYNQQSNTGRMLDPVIDKIGINIVMLVLAAHKSLPYWFFFIVLGRDLLILFASFFVMSHKNLVVESSKLGKWTVNIFALIIILFTFELDPWRWIFMWISVFLIPLTMINYARTHQDVIHSIFHKKTKGT